MATQQLERQEVQLAFPGMPELPAFDRECVIAMLSEVAAEAMRLSAFDPLLFLNFNTLGLDITLWSPRPIGPVCIREVNVDKWDRRDEIVLCGNESAADQYGRCEHYVSHRFSIRYGAPVQLVEVAVAEIRQLFLDIEFNIDAFRIEGVAA